MQDIWPVLIITKNPLKIGSNWVFLIKPNEETAAGTVLFKVGVFSGSVKFQTMKGRL